MMQDTQYHLVAGVAAFTGLPSVQVFSPDEESRASVKAQLFVKFEEYGNPEPLIFTGSMDEIRGRLRNWAKKNGFVYVENETNNLVTFKVKSE